MRKLLALKDIEDEFNANIDKKVTRNPSFN